ncbi:LacI family DNA-binding transcriptional regulator [Bifidobacterium aerophilum]|uniref:LacI family DNA-binding transcriptional regulator n=1 Tax=Bifidobacterium aerophilum TaxID=1798155 RepID=A0A6N9Z2C1_9BIFI|nr:LacI family DNA-binding transcriptional regulator [Bifidobacterium aerophilum]NEG88779.1 LacI family DNA-binding transcriptional regulator [Bifidobacterium aerophilum]
MATMTDVAKAAGVSRATASYALRGDPRISPATANKVRRAAASLNYTTNLSARSLRSGRSGVIGVAIFELDKPYPSEMSAAISREAARHGLETIVQQTSNSKEREISILRKVTSQLCDGTIFSPGNVSPEEITALYGGKPMILLDDISDDPLFDCVFTPCEAGAEAAIRHLYEVGCRNIGVLGVDYRILLDDSQATSVSGRRLAGALKAFDDLNINVDERNFVHTLWDMEHARATMHRLVDSGRMFDGLFCLTDTVALGALRGLADRGVRVPDDMAVIGFDGINEGEYSIPSLTTIETDLDDLAKKAIELLSFRLDVANGDVPEGTDLSTRRLTADFRLIERESTRR